MNIYSEFFPLNIVIFHSYVSLPKGISEKIWRFPRMGVAQIIQVIGPIFVLNPMVTSGFHILRYFKKPRCVRQRNDKDGSNI